MEQSPHSQLLNPFQMNILIGDDHELISAGIVANFAAQGRKDTFKTAKNKSELLERLQSESFDVLILDVQFGKDDARVVLPKLMNLYPELKTIALSSHEDEITVKSVLAAGFQSYVAKSAPLEELIDAVDCVSKGEQYISADLKNKLFSALFSPSAFSNEIKLTKREKQVLEQIQSGLSTKEIAELLFLSEKTIETYRSNLLLKFQVKNAASLVKESILKGYIF